MSIFDRVRGLFQPSAPPALPAPAGRADSYSSAATQSPYDGSGMVNALSGLGTVNDKGAAARPNIYRQPLSAAELEYLYRHTARRLIDLVPDNCTRRGWQVDVPDVVGNPFQDVEARLQLQENFRMAHIWARVFGGSRIWMVLREKGNPALTEPLRVERVTGVSNLVVLTPAEYAPMTYCSDPEDPAFRLPEIYSVHPGVGSVTEHVHHSRLLRFTGAPLPKRSERANRGEGESLLECWWDALRNDNQVGSAGALLAQELSVFWIQLRSAAAMQTAGGSATLLTRLRALNVSKSIANAILLSEGETIGEISRSTGGFKDLSDDAKRRLAQVTGYPMPVLFGEAPSGLNSDGESHRKLWAQVIASEQERHYLPALQLFYEILWQTEHSGAPPSWKIIFRPLDELTQTAQAQLEKTHVDTDAVRIDKGIISPEEARTRWSEEGYQDTLTIDPNEPAPELPDLTPPAPPTPTEEDPEDPDAEDPEEAEETSGEAPEDPEEDTEEEEGTEAAADTLSSRISARQRRRRLPVPKGAQRSALKVLRWRKAHGKSVRGLSASALDRCKQLSRGGTISVQDLITLNAWHARNSARCMLKPEFAGRPWKDAGYVASQAHGGETMARFAFRVVSEHAVRSDQAGRLTRLSQSRYARPRYARVLRIKEQHPDLWRRGGTAGNTWSGDRAFRTWTAIRQQDGPLTPTQIEWINRREAWAARHLKTEGTRQLAGAIAMIKWAVEDAASWRAIEAAIERKKKSEKKGDTAGQRAKAWRDWIRTQHAPAEAAIRLAVESYLRNAADRYAKAAKRAPGERQGLLMRMRALERARFQKAIRDAWHRAKKTAAQKAAQDLALAEQVARDLIEELDAEAEEEDFLDVLAEQVTEYTTDVVLDLLKDLVGLSPADRAAAVRRSPAFQPFRAVRIGTTEATRALNEGAQAAADAAKAEGGRVTVVWTTAGDEDVRTAHAGMDGQRRAPGVAFTSAAGNQAAYPGGFGIAAEDVNCRCMLKVERA